MAINRDNRLQPVLVLLTYLLVVFIGGALLAPWVYQLAHSIGPDWPISHSPFHRWVNRCFLVLGVLGIWPVLRSLGATSLREVGIVKPAGQWPRLIGGFALGFASLAIAAAIAVAVHGRQFNSALTVSQLARGLAEATSTALGVAIMEEILFRGTIFGGLRRFWDWRAALVLSSLIYAAVHFLQSADLPGPINWSSGIRTLELMLRGFSDLQTIFPALLSLTVVGLLLGLAYQRTGTLYFSIGLHAGWIFWLRAYGMLTVPVGNASNPIFGTQKLTDGWLTLCVLGLTLVLFLRLSIAKGKETTV